MRKKIVRPLSIGVIGILLVILYLFVSKHINIYIPCLFHKITGFYCPGCGITRMLYAIITGDLYQAFRYNPLLFITLPAILFLWIDYLCSLWKNKITLYQKIPNSIWIGILIIFIVYGIMRNLPAFEFLQPITL